MSIYLFLCLLHVILNSFVIFVVFFTFTKTPNVALVVSNMSYSLFSDYTDNFCYFILIFSYFICLYNVCVNSPSFVFKVFASFREITLVLICLFLCFQFSFVYFRTQPSYLHGLQELSSANCVFYRHFLSKSLYTNTLCCR